MNQDITQSHYINSGRYRHPMLGQVKVSVRVNSHRVSARWVGAEVHVNVPPALKLDDYLAIFSRFEKPLLESRPPTFHFIGREIETPELRITVRRSVSGCRGFKIIRERPTSDFRHAYAISVPEAYASDDRIAESEIQTHINTLICRVAGFHAQEVLLTRGRELSAALKRAPLAWNVGQGKHTLGSCSSNGVITLSSMLMFTPHHLRDYVILHEITHLSEMNHSARFHELCNSYCSGRESELVKELKAFRFPVF